MQWNPQHDLTECDLTRYATQLQDEVNVGAGRVEKGLCGVEGATHRGGQDRAGCPAVDRVTEPQELTVSEQVVGAARIAGVAQIVVLPTTDEGRADQAVEPATESREEDVDATAVGGAEVRAATDIDGGETSGGGAGKGLAGAPAEVVLPKRKTPSR